MMLQELVRGATAEYAVREDFAEEGTFTEDLRLPIWISNILCVRKKLSKSLL